ncbi:MAG: thiamine diphosphokinase [Trueperaceae bacterium]
MSDSSGAPDRTAVVLAAGTIPLPHLIPPLLDGADIVIAADGGLELARTLQLTPDLLVGDMDSVSRAALGAFPTVPRERHPAAKDELDLELALVAALQRGASEIRVLGAFGSRFDQSVAALLIAESYARGASIHGGAATPVPISLHGGNHEAHVLSAGQSRQLALPAGTTVSLLPLGEAAQVTSTGLAYELERTVLPAGTGLGVSNHVTGKAGERTTIRLQVHAGAVALMVEHDAAAHAPRTAIWGSQAERIRESLAAADPDLADLVTRVVYDEVFARPGLDLRTRELVSVAVLTALGAEDELTTHLRGALLVGATEQELRETLIHAAMFVGFPRAIQAMRQLQRFLDRRRPERPGPAS